MLSITPLDWWQANQNYIWFLAWIAGAILAGKAARLTWERGLTALSKRTKTELDGLVISATRRPVQFMVFLGVLTTGSRATLGRMPGIASSPVWSVYEGLLFVLLVLGGTTAALAVVRAVISWKEQKHAGTAAVPGRQFPTLLQRAAKAIFYFIAITIIFGHFGIEISGLLATAGVASLAVALAAQETIANWVAGMALMVDHPFKTGDRIQLPGGQIGDVLDVGMRSTRILSYDNTVIIIPNSEMAKSQVVNFNAPDHHITIRGNIGVAYGTDLRKVKGILMEVMSGHGKVMPDPAPAVYFTEFGESALNLLFICRIGDYRDNLGILDDLNMAIKDRFEAEGVRMPFPQMDVHMHTPPAGRGAKEIT